MAAPKGTIPPAAGKGRKKGTLNKNTKELKDMILKALDKKGGYRYLMEQADENPTAFLTLVGKVLPLTVKGEGDNGEIVITSTVRLVSGNKP